MRLFHLSLLLALCCGCYSVPRRLIREYGDSNSQDFVIIATEDRASLKSVKAFVDFKKKRGFSVSLIHFDIDRPPRDRIRQVRDNLRRHIPAEGLSTYVLIIASDSELPMGPWTVPGEDASIRSDLPLFLNTKTLPFDALQPDEWQEVLEDDFPWVFGRLPFADEQTLNTCIRSTVAFSTADRSTPPLALLGGERWMLPADSAFILNQAKQRFIQHGWLAELYATDKPNDTPITPHTGDTSCAPERLFIERWSRDGPQIVYTITHAGTLLGQWANKPIHGQGHYLISTSALNTILGQDDAFPPPASPAVFVTTGCSTGAPDNGLVDVLFANGWIAAFIGSTATTGPLPLLPAIGAEINIADCLGRGMPLGLAVRATEKTYFNQSHGLLDFLQDDRTRQMITTNILSYVIYGDPSLVCQRPLAQSSRAQLPKGFGGRTEPPAVPKGPIFRTQVIVPDSDRKAGLEAEIKTQRHLPVQT